ncbi:MULTISPECIES: type II toxin-antitoxin system RelE/ParE family toxin [Gilliamella]|uniref:type II toxin-antitoxin system RelE/ParE family toxin n=1 Tax=Gilliamella TaxID=1193503 RepID=UPI000A336BDA|nr:MULTISPECIES: type II toxin-antitoxin system RelE/ParE family toxin [Gilliamella]MBI0112908.1 type II toxin-antitoxin system RelE/ParE family toxin [Gilliamella sp. W8123]MBI0118315.1 type II toxin-antitoxin system RelE/ParE family toxin [Gilliamella sp. W8129]MBI0156121.1 type II toxin-antitoxin system RelE/ParE family toxin [Gilliamella sp. M0364]OTQ55556.1 hypothetical protein B6D21_06195 [Gilliamella apis]OTQ74859.1 hypothetical protein B6D14_11150 [Gilliamella apis]
MTVKYRVEIVDIASKDINQIYQYIKKYDCIENARYVFNQLRETIKKLEILPQRGSHPYELYEYGMIEYREINFKVYRIIYYIDETTKIVSVEMVIDSRRNLYALLDDRFK